jgi:phage gp36-like protein
MSYTTQDRLVVAAGGATKLAQLADFEGDGTGIDDVIARALAAADGWIDGYLRIRYATPIDIPSETLKGIADDEALYQIRKWRSALSLTEQDTTQRTQRIHELEAMQKGTMRPDDPAPARSSAASKAMWVPNTSPVSRWGMS